MSNAISKISNITNTNIDINKSDLNQIKKCKDMNLIDLRDASDKNIIMALVLALIIGLCIL